MAAPGAVAAAGRALSRALRAAAAAGTRPGGAGGDRGPGAGALGLGGPGPEPPGVTGAGPVCVRRGQAQRPSVRGQPAGLRGNGSPQFWGVFSTIWSFCCFFSSSPGESGPQRARCPLQREQLRARQHPGHPRRETAQRSGPAPAARGHQ